MFPYLFSGCGLSNKRIIGGDEARENEFPWMCSILYSDDEVDQVFVKLSSPPTFLLFQFYTCGATLLGCDPVIIVSAAHCFYGSVAGMANYLCTDLDV